MRHVIIGNGNLGYSLAKHLMIDEKNSIKILTASNGWKYPTSLQSIHDFTPDHVWVTVGAGSVEQAKKNYNTFIDLHVRLPVELAQTLNPSTVLHLFSSDYIHNPYNLYALSKLYMEDSIRIIKRPKTFIYRVGSLYGTYKPQNCFPYKLKKNSLKNNEIKLPVNPISPTPTDWLAKTALEFSAEFVNTWIDVSNVVITSLFPHMWTTCCSPLKWGEIILGYPIESSGVDSQRPNDAGIYCTPYTSWLDLWKERESEWQEILNKIT